MEFMVLMPKLVLKYCITEILGANYSFNSLGIYEYFIEYSQSSSVRNKIVF
jgi:hypothetical protein